MSTGLYYYGARYMNPKTSIWLSVDPINMFRSWVTPYNFVQNNPINLIDPTGMIMGRILREVSMLNGRMAVIHLWCRLQTEGLAVAGQWKTPVRVGGC
ncbi:MAG: hypothetical protein JJU02_14845 [Cryomorphaceae bacterium]|nr:hypothetical protein [Cryomorphaceae bacterium]